METYLPQWICYLEEMSVTDFYLCPLPQAPAIIAQIGVSEIKDQSVVQLIHTSLWQEAVCYHTLQK